MSWIGDTESRRNLGARGGPSRAIIGAALGLFRKEHVDALPFVRAWSMTYSSEGGGHMDYLDFDLQILPRSLTARGGTTAMVAQARHSALYLVEYVSHHELLLSWSPP